MKLCSLYIENFGCLRGFELDFETGLTTLNRPNGFGKTTLAEFIRAMFYGFPRKAKTLEKSKRQKYTPWGGGRCGGNLVFEHDGRRYRMERTFGSTPKADTFTLIDLATNRKSDRFSSEIGIELFGLDSDSFERSVYLPQLMEEETLTTASIQAKLTNLVEDSSDVGNYDKAMATLRAQRSALIPYRGNGGTVAEAAAQITRLQLQLDRAEHQHRQWMELQNASAQTAQELENIKAGLLQTQQKLAVAAETAAQMVQRDRYDRLRQEYIQIEKQMETRNNGYPWGFPKISELSVAEETADRLAVLESQSLSRGEPVRLPTQEELEACRKNCEEFAALRQELRAAEAVFGELVQKERERLAVPPEKTGSAAVIALWILSILGIGIGAVLMVVEQLLYGSIALGVGVIAILAACVLMISRRKRLRDRLMRKKQESDRFVAEARQRLAALRRRDEQQSAEIALVFAGFGMDVPPQQFLAALARLEHRLQLSGEIRQREAEMEQYRKELVAFFARYGQKPEDFRGHLRQMRDDLREMRTLKDRKEELAEHLTQLEREYPDITSLPHVAAEDLQELRQREHRLRNASAELTETLLQQKQELQHLQSQTARIPALREELTQLQKQMAEDRGKARILDETMAFLRQARERLSTSYMDTIRNRFAWYVAQLEVAAGEKYLIDTDLQVYPERMGQTRELAYFSAGQTDLVMLCMRLALVDALFREENMFVILDDPFVNLDDAHTQQALKLLRGFAQNRQILYLTCHSSRSV